MLFLFSLQCNLLYIQKTPEICEFLGLAKPPTTTPATITTSTSASTNSSSVATTESNKKPNTNDDNGLEDNNRHPAEKTGSVGSKFTKKLCFFFAFLLL